MSDDSAPSEISVEATGETVGEAKWKALRELERTAPGVDKSRVRFQVVSEGERGLLGVAFDPNFSTEKWVYVYYTATSPSIHNRVSRFPVSSSNPDVASTAEDVLFDLPNLGAIYHNGGALQFGADGVISSQLFGVGAHDSRVAVGAILLLAVVAIVAVLVPARRATLIDPRTALNAE